MMIVADMLVFVGLLFILAGVVGILRLADFYTRLHAMGKCDALGVALILLGLAIHAGWSRASLKILLIVVFVWLANPTATHALGRAALQAGLVPWRQNSELH
jgi:multicomponent Na+:H+ antiporter subunit G